MAKVRVVFAEVEGTDAAVQCVVAGFLERCVPDGPAAALPAPCEEPRPAAALLPAGALAEVAVSERRRVVRRVKGKQVPAVKAEPVREQGDGERGEVREAILAVLRKRPMTSPEVVAATGRTSGNVYVWLKRLREEKVIETRECADDGLRKNFLL